MNRPQRAAMRTDESATRPSLLHLAASVLIIGLAGFFIVGSAYFIWAISMSAFGPIGLAEVLFCIGLLGSLLTVAVLQVLAVFRRTILASGANAIVLLLLGLLTFPFLAAMVDAEMSARSWVECAILAALAVLLIATAIMNHKWATRLQRGATRSQWLRQFSLSEVLTMLGAVCVLCASLAPFFR